MGAGLGALRPGPGTWGSAGGLIIALALAASHSPALWLGAALFLTALAIPLCGRAEQILGETDPGCVVLDEIVAMVWAYLPAAWPGPLACPARSWVSWAAGFAGFRLLDIFKPPPIRQLQSLPGGWGIVADDLAAAALTAAALAAAQALWR